MSILKIIESNFPRLKSEDVNTSDGDKFIKILFFADKPEFQSILETMPDFSYIVGRIYHFKSAYDDFQTAVLKHFTDTLKDQIELLEIEAEPTLDHTTKLIQRAPKTNQHRSVLGVHSRARFNAQDEEY